MSVLVLCTVAFSRLNFGVDVVTSYPFWFRLVMLSSEKQDRSIPWEKGSSLLSS